MTNKLFYFLYFIFLIANIETCHAQIPIYAGYDGSSCTIVVKNKLIKLDRTSRIDIGNDFDCWWGGDNRFLPVKIDGLYNLYDTKNQTLLLAKGVDYMFRNWGRETARRIIVVSFPDQKKVERGLDIKTGKFLDTFDSDIPGHGVYIYGPYGKNDIFVRKISGESNCQFFRFDKNGHLFKIYTTEFNNCQQSRNDSESVIALTNNKSGAEYFFDSDSLILIKSGVDLELAKYSRRYRCDNVYVGRVFWAKGGIFKMNTEYEIIGVSPSMHTATLKSGSYKQEVSCSDLPD